VPPPDYGKIFQAIEKILEFKLSVQSINDRINVVLLELPTPGERQHTANTRKSSLSIPRIPIDRHIGDRHIGDRHIGDRHIGDRHIGDRHIGDRYVGARLAE